MFEFSQSTIENIGYYVYCLIDSRDKTIFYIGKGCGNRVFAHEHETLEKEKNKRIYNIKKSGAIVEKYIIRHGLSEEEAFHLEAALIDIFSSDVWNERELLNIMEGHHCLNNGMKSVSEIEAYYCVEKITKEKIRNNCLIVNINSTYKPHQDVYDATRKSWLLNDNKISSIELVICEYRGIFRAIYKPEKWYTEIDEKGRKRWLFEGKDVSDRYPEYMNKFNAFKKRGARNPISYVFNAHNKLKLISKKKDDTSIEDINKDEIHNNCLIVNINKTYIPHRDLYDATRKSWLLNASKIKNIELVISEYHGTFLAIYKPERWYTEIDEKGRVRWLFEGEDVSDKYPEYMNKHNAFKKRGAQNPISYVFGKEK